MLNHSNKLSNREIVKVEDLAIVHGNQLVLRDVNFNINQSEFVFLIGKTGSGKSSLLKTLYADIPVRYGVVCVVDFDLRTINRSEIPFLRRTIGMVFQDFQLFMDRNVEENLKFVLNATGWKDKNAIYQRIEESLIRVGLSTNVFNKMIHKLSGGEQQRVAIARALLNVPTILFADEPTGNLDPDVANEILDLFIHLNKGGTAVLMATHNYSFLKRTTNNRILKCQDGYISDSCINEL